MTIRKELNLRPELSKFKTSSGYMRTKTDGKKETWEEAVSRVMQMHYQKYSEIINENTELMRLFSEAEEAYANKFILGSQRSLQFGGDQIFKHNTKIYNCATTHVDRPEVFREIFYVLLCGSGVGASVQFQHVKHLPFLTKRGNSTETFVIEDSIEGWADALGVLMASYFRADDKFKQYYGVNIRFDYSQIREEGSYISGGFKAPGPKGLKNALEKIEELLENLINSKGSSFVEIRPIDCYDIICHASDAVLSGGVRRSATIIMFSMDDVEMLNSKIGNWFVTNPQRARSNNSCVMLKDETTFEQFNEIFKRTKEFGEPGFIWVKNLDHMYNPCVEAGMLPKLTVDKLNVERLFKNDVISKQDYDKVLNGEEVRKSGWQFCNLNEINGAKCDTEEKFYYACERAAILGSIQAGYTDFSKYLTKVTQEIVEREALLGVSITGMANNPEILFNPEIQKKGAQIVVETNKKVAKMLGTNPAARCTNIKPAGNSSVILESASGISAEHSKMFLRNVQVNKNETAGKLLKVLNPHMFEESVWSATKSDWVASFPIIVPEGSLLKKDYTGVKQLELVRLTQQNWVEFGSNDEVSVDPTLRHNVSNTINVDDWDEVEKYIYDNREFFAGVSLLSISGDKDYAQAPFTSVYTPKQMLKEYGDGAFYSSGIIIDAFRAFNNNLWLACDTALGIGMKLEHTDEEIVNEISSLTIEQLWKNLGLKGRALKLLIKEGEKPTVEEYREYMDEILINSIFNGNHMKTWVKKFKKFASNYFNGDLKQASYCLKDVNNYNKWKKITDNYKPLNYDEIVWAMDFIDVNTMGAQACSGGKCDI